MALATTEAFAPSKIHSSPQSTVLFAEENNNFLPKLDAKAASLIAASFLAFSTVGVATTAIPTFVQPAQAASKVAVPEKKLSKEEKEYVKAKSNVDLANKTLKSYEQLGSDANDASKKASNALEVATKNTASAKKAYTTVADKLAAAKKQKMPTSAVKELTADAGTRTKIAQRVCVCITIVNQSTTLVFCSVGSVVHVSGGTILSLLNGALLNFCLMC